MMGDLMHFRRHSSLLLFLTCGLALTGASAVDAPSYQARLSLSSLHGGREVVLAKPSILLRMGQPATVSVVGDNAVYRFDVIIEQQGERHVADAKAVLTQGKRVLIAPHLSTEVGHSASVTAGDFKFSVDVQDHVNR